MIEGFTNTLMLCARMHVGYLLIRVGHLRVARVYIHAYTIHRLTIDMCKELRGTCRRLEFGCGLAVAVESLRVLQCTGSCRGTVRVVEGRVE